MNTMPTTVPARRKDDVWYLAAMTDWDERTLEADLSFLLGGDYTLEIFRDGINADHHGEDYKHVTVSSDATGKMELSMAAGGGWVAKITRKEN